MMTRHAPEGSSSTMRIMLIIWGFIAVIVLILFFFGREKEELPPPSIISYEKKPGVQRVQRRYDDFSDEHRGRARRRDAGPEAVASQAPQPKENLPFRIEGTLKDARTSKPITKQNCWISAERMLSGEEKARWMELKDGKDFDEFDKFEDEVKFETSTHPDAQGEYAIGSSKAGDYSVRVWAEGYMSAPVKTAYIDESQPLVRLDFALSQGARISGKVMEKGANKPAPEIAVFAQGQVGQLIDDGSEEPKETEYVHQQAKTNENGEYVISGLPVGAFTVEINVEDRPYQIVGGAPTKGVTVHSIDEEVKNINFEVEAAGEVWGYVTLAKEKEPVDNALVVLCTSESIITQVINQAVKQRPPLGDNSDKEGYYEIIGVPLNQEWRLYSLPKEAAPQMTDPFVLTDTQRSARIDILLPTGSTVDGRVVTSDGKPIPRAQVICIPGFAEFLSPLATAHAFRELRSEEDGSFLISSLPAGTYQILAQKDGYKFVTRGEPVYPNGYSDIHGVQVVLPAVESGRYSVYGMVTDQDGKPIPSASVELGGFSEDFAGEGRDTKTDATGNYAFQGVDPGFLMLAVNMEGYATKMVNDVKLDEPTDVVLEATATVRGVVVVKDVGDKPAGFSVRAMPSLGGAGNILASLGETRDNSFTTEDGSFQMSLAAGSYTLEARAQGFTPGRTSISLREGQQLDGVVISISRSGASISGRVRLADAGSPSGTIVWLTGGESSVESLLGSVVGMGQGGITVGDDGAFEFESLPGGAYTVMARREGLAQGHSNPLTLGEGQHLTGVEVRLGSGGALEGYVLSKGQVQQNMAVTVFGNGVTKMTTSDRNGHYRIDAIPAGTYMASAISMDPAQLLNQFAPRHAQVEIADGRDTTYNFGEEVGATILGVCNTRMRVGTLGFAVLHSGGAPGSVPALAFSDPTSLLTGEIGPGIQVVGMTQIDRDGYFELENVPPGSFFLDVYVSSLGELMSGNVRAVFSTVVTVTGQETQNLTINLEEQ